MNSVSNLSLKNNNQVKNFSFNKTNSKLKNFLKIQFKNNTFNINIFKFNINYIFIISINYFLLFIKFK